MEHLIPEPVWQKLLKPNLAVPQCQIFGGLSAALLLRCTSPHGDLCLRGWPPGQPSHKALIQMRRAVDVAVQRQIHLLPGYRVSSDQQTWINADARIWELTYWLPGQADYAQRPASTRLRNALRALANLHAAWGSDESTWGPSPAVDRRHHLLCQWLSRQKTGQPSCPPQATNDETLLFHDTWECLRQFGPGLVQELQTQLPNPVRLHTVLRDVHAEHVLFELDQVTGVIDLGAMQTDEPATDVARLLGSLEPHCAANWQAGIDDYRSVHEIDPRRVALLDRSSCLLAALQWMQWLTLEGQQFNTDREKLLRRWGTFLLRLRQPQWPDLSAL